jgi:hypothetical protein
VRSGLGCNGVLMLVRVRPYEFGGLVFAITLRFTGEVLCRTRSMKRAAARDQVAA